MILFFSFKDSFDENFNFDFSKKYRIKYNLEEIEEQLEYLLLPGKKKFSSKLDFVIYQYEGFRNQNSSILSTFITNYPQKALDEEEKRILYEFRSEQYSTDTIKKILFSIQLMITFYNEQLNIIKNSEVLISETINDFPHYFKIPEDTKNLFANPFTLSKIVSVYEYFELLCFEEFKKNIDPSYKEQIAEEKKEKIEKYFSEHPNNILNKLIISTTIRKFISRSLVGIREDIEIGANIELFSILIYKEDCWNKEIFTNALFVQEIEGLQQLDIKVGEILNLYEILGGDSVLLGEIVKNKVEEKVEENKKQPKKDKNKRKNKQGKKAIF